MQLRKLGILCLATLSAACTIVPVPHGPEDVSEDEQVDAATAGRVAAHDPLSMPERPTVAIEDFHSSSYCAGCHPTHFAQWKTSMHAYAMKDPVFRAFVARRQSDFDGQQDQTCVQCHSSIGTRGGDIVRGFSFDELDPLTLEGVTCEACHKVVGLERPFNSGHVLDGRAAMHGPIDDPAENSFHASTYSPLHDTSAFCAGCHDVVEANGLDLERPFVEWANSPAAAAGRNCQSCHMPTYAGTASVLLRVPERENLHVHRFIGVDVPLDDDFVPDVELRRSLRSQVIALLRTSGALELEGPTSVRGGEPIELAVTVRNLIDAHNLPTGSTFNRQLWLELVATDADGTVLYETGNLDDNGDLRDAHSTLDPNGDRGLITLHSGFLAADGTPTVFPWRAAEQISNALAPLAARTFSIVIPTRPESRGPITIESWLRFRALPPYLLRALGLVELVDKVEIMSIDEATLTIDTG